MSAQHTPGPWTVEEDMRPGMAWNRHIHSDPNTAVCFMAHSDDREPERDEANARLIAAAPELLEALKKLSAEISSLHIAAIRDALGNTNAAVLELRATEAAAAIAKATGETA